MIAEQTDVLIIGAGPAGCIAAAIIRKQGFRVQIVEREVFPRFVIGESLLPRVMDHLEEAGLLEAVKKAGFQEKFGAKFVRGNQICDFNFDNQFTNGWNWTWQVPRADFDKLLADTVELAGVAIEYQSTVTNVNFFSGYSQTTIIDKNGLGKKIESKFIVDASGYGRVLPRMLGLDKPSNFESRKTHFTHFRDLKRPEGVDGNRITVIIHQQKTWIWIIPFSNGITSVGVVADPDFYNSFSEDPTLRMREIIESDENTSNRFKDAEIIFDPRSIEGYAISTKQMFGDGFVLVGNATEFLDPIFSSGVTFAMESGNKAGKLVGKFLRNEPVDWQREYTDHMMQGINTFRTFVEGWYNGDLHEIFFHENQNEKIKSQICSVLAGYVWDLENPFVRKHKNAVGSLAKIIRMRKGDV